MPLARVAKLRQRGIRRVNSQPAKADRQLASRMAETAVFQCIRLTNTLRIPLCQILSASSVDGT